MAPRTHFARFLVEQGHCKDTSRCSKFLTEGKPGEGAAPLGQLKDAIRWINDAGGMAVIAHPGRYKFTANEEYARSSLEFKAHGGRAVEAVTGSHTLAEHVEYADKALEFGLAASRQRSSRREPLHLVPPVLPGKLTPVWELLADRIQHVAPVQ